MKKIHYIWMAGLILAFQGTLFAAAEDLPPPPDQGMWQTFVMIAIALLFFYLILWRPEQKRRKVIEQQRSALKKGDKVTAMGIIGTVSRVTEQTIVLKMIDGSKIEFLKAAITDVLPATEAEPQDLKKEEEV